MKRLLLILCAVIPLSLAGGYLLRGVVSPVTPAPAPEFHDLRVNPIGDYVALMQPEHPEIMRHAGRFASFEEAYRFVSDEIRFAPFVPPGPVHKTLEYGVGSCLGKAALLASLYRAMGMPAGNVRMVMGVVMTPQGPADHVWLDLEHQGRCLQQDPSGMLGRFDFHAFPENRYVENYVLKESFAFNEEGFAVVSQLNRFRNGGGPMAEMTD